MSHKPYKPDQIKYPGVLVVAPYPYRGVPENTDTRLHATANRLGVHILGWQAKGTGRVVIDLATRDKLKPSNYDQTCSAEAKRLRPYQQDYSHIVGWGDSRSATTVMGLQLNDGLFDRLLLRDGYNHKAPQSLVAGWLNFLLYQYRDKGSKLEDSVDAPPTSPTPAKDGWRRGLAEMTHYSQLMRSRYGTDAAVELAGDQAHSALPIRSVGLTHSFTGDAIQALNFAETLNDMRERLKSDIGHTATVADLRADIEEGYHSDLLRPDRAARHLEETLALAPVRQAL